MRLLRIFALLILTPLYAQSQQNSPPLTDEEKRQVLIQLYELRSCRESVNSYGQYISRETEQDAREKANYERAVDLEKQATALAQKERDLAIEKAKYYEQLYRSVSKKPGIGCRLKRIFTLGLARCQ
jgi:hypothetical protein